MDIKNTLAVIIFAKDNSERVPNKNCREFYNGKSILQLKVEQLNKMEVIPYISTDTDRVWYHANKYGSKCKRLHQTQYPKVTISDVYKEACEQLTSDHVMMCNCTSPFVKPNTYQEFIKAWLRVNNEYSSIATVNFCKQFLWSTETGMPVNYDYKHQPRSQDLMGVVEINWACVITRREDVLKNGAFLHYPAYLYNIDINEAIDIDTMRDFDFAKELKQNKEGL